MPESNRHFVAVIGGAVSGSVAAEILAECGVEVAVIEQNDRPYGKIEDGLPRWHAVQRREEYKKINERLSKPLVHFVPRTRLGRDLDFAELTRAWGLSAVLLANGAWRDRAFPVAGADALVGKGLEYQNPFIHWFNHKGEKSYAGRRIDVPDGAAVFGGGLASIDVVKVCQLEVYGRALEQRGIRVPMHELEKKGVPEVCAAHGIRPADLGVRGCTLFYRRRIEDMPLAQPPANATPEQLEKTLAARRKLLERAQEKFLFAVQDRTVPVEMIVANGRVSGVRIARTKVEGKKADPIPGSEAVFETRLVLSSVGSIPEPIPGVSMKGETYTFSDWDLGIYQGAEGVFGVGNVVTGQGNIRASLLHSRKVTEYVTQKYLGAATGAAAAAAVNAHLATKPPLSPERLEEIRRRVRALQSRASYGGDYMEWIRKVTPADLE